MHVNRRGLDFYERLVDALLDAGVQPLINLFHWDLPQALQDRGGFANPQVVGWFTDYAALLADDPGRPGQGLDDVQRAGRVTPSSAMPTASMRRACATGRRRSGSPTTSCAPTPAAAEAIRAHRRRARRSASRSTSTRSRRRPTRSAIGTRPSEWSSARDAWFLDPLFGRGYPALGLEAHRAAGHLEGVDLAEPPAGDLDYLGLNYYRRDSVSASSDRAFDWEIGAVAGSEQTQMDWHVAPGRPARHPASTCTGRTRRARSWSRENGAAYPDAVEPDGQVHDAGRVAYLARHVAAAADAIGAGVPVTGYYVWSFLDNYEWSLGYARRFGLVHVDYDSQRRTPKDSARWYQRLIAGA